MTKKKTTMEIMQKDRDVWKERALNLERQLDQEKMKNAGEGELIYLATPYTHEDPAICEMRHQIVTEVASGLFSTSHSVFSPISHCHEMARQYSLPTDWTYWQKYNRTMISRCTRLLVLCLEGWRESVGVQAEIKIAEEFGLSVEYVTIHALVHLAGIGKTGGLSDPPC